jgi:hypothetical protein
MNNLAQESSPSTWELTVNQARLDLRGREQLLESIRPKLEQELSRQPELTSLQIPVPCTTVEARRTGGTFHPGAKIELRYRPEPSAAKPTNTSVALRGTIPALELPNAQLLRLSERLVGLESVRTEILLRWACLWDGAAAAWVDLTNQDCPDSFLDHLREQLALTIFAGDPGTGKSALARVIADQYCRINGIAGTVLLLQTDVRGNGMVGDFGNRIRYAFDMLAQLPTTEFRCLIIDEADSVAMRRSEAHSHHEDRAATATLLQCLDRLCGEQRLAVFLTTNLLRGVDAAIRRRAVEYTFERPGNDAREAILSKWLPGTKRVSLRSLVSASAGMTPADIERAICSCYCSAIQNNAVVTPAHLRTILRSATRTEAV